MFNSFVAQRKQKQKQQKLKEKQKIYLWNKKYRTQVRPILVQKYGRRINGFAKKMQDQPIIVNSKDKGKNSQAFFRDFDRSLHVSKQNFMFKNADDWKSIYTPLERAERQQIMRNLITSTNHSMAFRSILSQSKYSDVKVEFRSRQKAKDVNPPMKYTNKNPQIVLISLPKVKSKHKKMKIKSQLLPKARKLSFEDRDEDGDIDLSSLNSSLMYKRNATQHHIKTQKQLIQQQQMKALAHKRLYFKSLIDLQQNVKTAKQKNQLKQVLIKCGIYRPTAGKIYQEQDVDKFLQIMKTKQN